MWEEQDQRHPGDRDRLFAAVADVLPGATRVLYPGSFVDLAPSFVFEHVTYVDMDRRAATFFADADGVDEIIADRRVLPAGGSWAFLSSDYTQRLDLPTKGFDLLVSLYAGFVSEHCSRHLRPGGHLLVNPSHGDVAMASIDPAYELAGVVVSRSGNYRVSRKDLASYLIPKDGEEVTKGRLHELGRGIAYTKSPFAYLFRKR
ncbi:MAG: hypothetical protein HKN46_09945 [Acidimicrobiia bacterium]|nr:hypothetical protein [Acidimicrobiia bacterium]